MYYNPGSHEVGGAQKVGVAQRQQTESKASPPHWHYVSCGLSDLHGDGRVHK